MKQGKAKSLNAVCYVCIKKLYKWSFWHTLIKIWPVKGSYDYKDSYLIFETTMETRNASTVAWAALVVALLALVLAWLGYSRAGGDVTEDVDQATEEVQDTTSNVVEELDEEFVDENEPGDVVETETSVDVEPSN